MLVRFCYLSAVLAIQLYKVDNLLRASHTSLSENKSIHLEFTHKEIYNFMLKQRVQTYFNFAHKL